MDKKDIYEHLAKIYLDASSKKKIKSGNYQGSKRVFVASLALVFILSFALFSALNRNKPLKSENSLWVSFDAAKINFNFDPAKKEEYSINLKDLNLNGYKSLAFSLKKSSRDGKITLRVEMVNNFKERSEVYIKDIPPSWQEYKINFSEFAKINDWSDLTNLSFVVEQWNTKENKGIVFIDNVRFLR